ncbi:MAG: hypothetical protein ACRDFW_06770 [bacterium]
MGQKKRKKEQRSAPNAATLEFSRDTGDRAAALKYAERLRAQSPDDPAVQQLLKELRRGADAEP